jgi:hypothetical protein
LSTVAAAVSSLGSILFPTSSYLGSGSALTLGTTCTFEYWFRTTANPATSKFVLLGGSGNRGLNIYNGAYGQSNYSATVIQLDWETADNRPFTVPTMTADTWYHLAVTFSAGTATLWLNGTRSSTGTVVTGWNFQSQTYRIGAWVSQAIYSQGVYISTARLTTTEVYDITQTTITVPTGPLTAITGTKLLLNMATNATAYTDSSASPIAMTATGRPIWTSLDPFSDGPVTSGLVLYHDPNTPASYPGTGTTVNNLLPTNLTGTMGNITYTDPYFNYNGTSSTVSVADTAALEPGTGDFTVEAWVYYSVLAGSTRTFVSKTDNGGLASNWSYGLRTNGTTGATYFEVGNGTTSNTSPTFTVTTGTWYQIVGVWTNVASDSIALYVNGANQGSNSHAFTSVKNSTRPLYLGSYNGGEYSQWFNGRMGIVRIYNTALSDAQVLQNYNANRATYGL